MMTEKSHPAPRHTDTTATTDTVTTTATPIAAVPATPTTEAVARAAADIVAAFAATDTDAYFAGFAAEASFVFHPEARRLNSRAEYEETWAGWLAEGWSVVDCVSSEPLIQTFPGGAVFSHTVDTTVETGDGRESYTERESIVFRHLGDGGLIAIHEHLSTVPDPAVPGAGNADVTGTDADAEAVAR